MEESDIHMHTAGKTYGCNNCTVHHGYVLGMNSSREWVLSTRQSSYPLQTYIQQMVVTLDYSTMNVEQIAQAMN